jgi:hypothetical protein
MAKPPDDPEPSSEPVAWTAEDTYRLLTSRDWEARDMASLFSMWQKPGRATFFEVLARLLREKAVTDAFVANQKKYREKRNIELVEVLESAAEAFEILGAELRRRNAELANPAGALSGKRRGTTSTKKPWRQFVLADETLMVEVRDPAVEPAGLACRIEKLLDEAGKDRPLRQAIIRWIKRERKQAAAQAQ